MMVSELKTFQIFEAYLVYVERYLESFWMERAWGGIGK